MKVTDKIKKLMMLPLAFIVLFQFTGGTCGNVIGPDGEVIFPEGEEEVSYILHVEPFMKLKCGFAGCHDENYAAGGRVMTRYIDLISQLGLIVSGDPDGSLLIQVLDGRNPHLQNYRDNYINDNQLQGMRRWIAAGAPNN